MSLGFNMDNLKNSFRADPNYEIPANVFLQDMTQVNFMSIKFCDQNPYITLILRGNLILCITGSEVEGSCSDRFREKIYKRIFQSPLLQQVLVEFVLKLCCVGPES